MNKQESLIAHPKTEEQARALKAFLKARDIRFEQSSEVESPYDPEFVAKIKESKQEYEKGNYTRVAKEDLKKYLGLE